TAHLHDARLLLAAFGFWKAHFDFVRQRQRILQLDPACSFTGDRGAAPRFRHGLLSLSIRIAAQCDNEALKRRYCACCESEKPVLDGNRLPAGGCGQRSLAARKIQHGQRFSSSLALPAENLAISKMWEKTDPWHNL